MPRLTGGAQSAMRFRWYARCELDGILFALKLKRVDGEEPYVKDAAMESRDLRAKVQTPQARLPAWTLL